MGRTSCLEAARPAIHFGFREERADRRASPSLTSANRRRDKKPTLRVLGWDDDDTNLKLDYVADELHEKLTWPHYPSEVFRVA